MSDRPCLRLRYGTKLFLTHLLAVFLVSGSVGTFFYVNAMDSLMRSLRSRLQNSAALLSHAIDARTLEGIRGPDDTAQDAYRATLETLRRMRRSNPDIAFLYVMRRDDDRTVFVVDSDETERQAPPGQVYEDAPPTMQQGFHSPAVDDQLYRDEWGVFLSGYAPLRHGEGRYLIGIDMNASEVAAKLKELRLTGLVSLLASMLLALLFAHLLSRGLLARIVALSARCREIAMGRFGARVEMRACDEFDDLIEAFNTMSERIREAHEQEERALAELRVARDGLQGLVEERTRELERAAERVQVLRGLLPVCSSCKKIRDDQGYWRQVEQFVAAHLDARVTHGICPDCAVKLYGDAAKD
jgi:methyl-accepting chemotaxis protein